MATATRRRSKYNVRDYCDFCGDEAWCQIVTTLAGEDFEEEKLPACAECLRPESPRCHGCGRWCSPDGGYEVIETKPNGPPFYAGPEVALICLRCKAKREG